jgi:hypothetical protein
MESVGLETSSEIMVVFHMEMDPFYKDETPRNYRQKFAVTSTFALQGTKHRSLTVSTEETRSSRRLNA